MIEKDSSRIPDSSKMKSPKLTRRALLAAGIETFALGLTTASVFAHVEKQNQNEIQSRMKNLPNTPAIDTDLMREYIEDDVEQKRDARPLAYTSLGLFGASVTLFTIEKLRESAYKESQEKTLPKSQTFTLPKSKGSTSQVQ